MTLGADDDDMAIISDPTGANQAKVNPSGQLMTRPSTRVLDGLFISGTTLQSVQASAHGATAGFIWLINPIGNTKLAAIRRVEIDQMGVAVAAAITRFTAERVTFTGVASGATITPGKVDSLAANNSCLLLSASTGLTLSAGAVLYSYLTMGVITAAGVAEPVINEWAPTDEDGMPILRAGEGIVIRQPDAGVASDPRRAVINLAWEEWTP